MEIYGSIKLKGSLDDGTGDPLLTKDASTNSVGTAANALGTLTSAHLFVGDGSNVPTDVAVTGDVTISNAGVTSITAGCIVNADVSASAALAFSKMAALTVSRALVSDGSGVVSVATTTATEIGYVNGVTSAIQTQFSGKQATITGGATTITSSDLTASKALISNGSGKVAVSTVTSTELGYVAGVTSAIQTQLNTKLGPTISSVAEGDMLYYNGTAWVNLARGTNGQALYSTATSIQWDTPTINGIPIGGTTGQVLAKQSGTDFDADWDTLTVSSITDLTATAAELNVLDGITATVTELNYVDGVSSPIQTQLDNKLSTSLAQNALFYGNSSNVATSLAAGTNGYVLTSVSGVPTWSASSAGTPPGSDTQVIFNDGGSFGADAGMVYDKTNDALTVGLARIHTTGTARNLFIGEGAGNFTATGIDNCTGLGYHTLQSMTTGADFNTAIGSESLDALTTGIGNTAVGTSSLGAIQTGSYNTAVGYSALSLATSNFNVGVGGNAGDNITSGTNNVVIGYGVDAQSATANGQLSIQNALFGLLNTATGTTLSTGTIGVYVAAPTASLDIIGSTTAKSSLRIRSGTAPSPPNAGDFWFDGTNLKFYDGSTTKTLTWS